MPEFEEPMQDGSSGFSITLNYDPVGVQVRVVGELDLASAPELGRVLETLEGDGYSRLLLDLDGLKFIDSSGLAVIAGANRSANSNGHRLTIRCSSSQVRRLLELTGMLEYLNFE